jgi:hypothetical protein
MSKSKKEVVLEISKSIIPMRTVGQLNVHDYDDRSNREVYLNGVRAAEDAEEVILKLLDDYSALYIDFTLYKKEKEDA